MSAAPSTRSAPPRTRLRVGSVSFLNARPLIHGLEEHQDVQLGLDVPSRLLEDLKEHRFDLALLPVIDYQRMDGLLLVPGGGIGCDGPTLTVRIFSRTPVERITSLACDTDSHTSVALARIILAEAHGVRPELVEWNARTETHCDARLVIGDKVVCEEPAGFPHQIDLGEAWKRLTGLPFVFAAWTARQGVDLGDLPQRLERAKRAGLAGVKEIVRRYAVPRGWPADVAQKYLTEYLKFDVGERQVEAIRLFHQKAAEHAIVPRPIRPLRVYS